MHLNHLAFPSLPQSSARCSESPQNLEFQMRLRTKVLSVLLAASLVASATPAFAGPAETAFLQKLTATWSGKGKLNGAKTGPIACKIVITAGGKSTKYQGRCNIPDMAQQAFSGSISYNDKTKHYETRSVSGTVPGIRKGDKLVFRTSEPEPSAAPRPRP